MDIVLKELNNHTLRLQKQISCNEKSKELLLSFKDNLDTFVNKTYEQFVNSKCIHYKSFLLSEAIQFIKNECDLISSNVNMYITNTGNEVYIQAIEYADTIIMKLESELESLHNQKNHNYIGTFSMTENDIDLSQRDHNEMNNLIINDDYEREVSMKDKILIPNDIFKFYYKQKYGDSKKRKKDSSIYDSDHFQKWYKSAEKRKSKIISTAIENEYDLYKYYEKRFGNRYQRKRDPTIFDSVHFNNWISKKKEHLNNVEKHLKEKL